MPEAMGTAARRLLTGIVLLAVFTVLYVLSVGPAVRVVRGLEDQSPILRIAEAFYSPLEWTLNTPLQKPLDAYIDFWDRD